MQRLATFDLRLDVVVRLDEVASIFAGFDDVGRQRTLQEDGGVELGRHFGEGFLVDLGEGLSLLLGVCLERECLEALLACVDDP